MLEFWNYIILGMVQGFTEPLPISSSGHLEIAMSILNVKDLSLEVFSGFVNFGSTIAIVIYFRKDILRLLSGLYSYIKTKGKKSVDQFDYILKIIVATIPIGIIGPIYVLSGFELEDNIKNVGIALIITSLLLLLVLKKKGVKSVKELTWTDVLIIGLFQSFAIMPGISRSGATLVAALLVGTRKRDAFEFSFLMYIPASIGALVLSLIPVFFGSSAIIPAYFLSLVVAFVFTLLGLVLVKKVIVQQKLIYFSIYCLIAGTLTLFLL